MSAASPSLRTCNAEAGAGSPGCPLPSASPAWGVIRVIRVISVINLVSVPQFIQTHTRVIRVIMVIRVIRFQGWMSPEGGWAVVGFALESRSRGFEADGGWVGFEAPSFSSLRSNASVP